MGIVLLGFTFNVLSVSMFVLACVVMTLVAYKTPRGTHVEYELTAQFAREAMDLIQLAWAADPNSICKQLDRKYAK